MKAKRSFWRTVTALVSAAVIAGWATGAEADASDSHGHQEDGATTPMDGGMMSNRLSIPQMTPDIGKRLFIDKGCVACHAVNGVGGHDAANLDAHTMNTVMNPFEFAARMWNHAGIMIPLQEEAIGEQITFTGDELANIIAFVHNDEVQHSFMEGDLTPNARQMMNHSHGDDSMEMMHADELGHGHDDGEDTHEPE